MGIRGDPNWAGTPSNCDVLGYTLATSISGSLKLGPKLFTVWICSLDFGVTEYEVYISKLPKWHV